MIGQDIHTVHTLILNPMFFLYRTSTSVKYVSWNTIKTDFCYYWISFVIIQNISSEILHVKCNKEWDSLMIWWKQIHIPILLVHGLNHLLMHQKNKVLARVNMGNRKRLRSATSSSFWTDLFSQSWSLC